MATIFYSDPILAVSTKRADSWEKRTYAQFKPIPQKLIT